MQLAHGVLVLGQAVAMVSEMAVARSSPVRRRSGFVTALLGLLAAGFVVIAGLRLFGIDGNRYTVAVLALTPYVTVGGVLFALFSLLLRRWVIGGGVLLVGLIMVSAVLPRVISNPQPSRAGQQLRVLSANLLLGQADAAAVVSLVRTGRVDVLSLQELTPAAVTALDRAGLTQELPYRVFQPLSGVEGSGLASRFPLRELSQAQTGAEPSTNAQPAALVDLPGRADVEVVAVHPVPPVLPLGFASWKRELAGLPKADFKGTARILVGDFNATLDHVGLRDVLADGYVDAADQRGEGLTPTWPGGLWPPPVTIDHVLVDAKMAVEHYEVFNLPGSDHDAVYARVVVPN